MRSRDPLDRITVTIPRPLLEEADRLAAELGRSRSWVLTEALRQMVRGREFPGADRTAGGAIENDPDLQRRRLEHALRLPPEDRLLEGEELVRLGRMLHPQRWRRQIISFDTYEEYARWKTASRAGA